MKTKLPFKPKNFRTISVFSFFLFTFSFAFIAHTQTPPAPRGVIRLKVRYKTGDVPKDLSRKRFFLIKGSLEENKGLIEKMKQTDLLSRECYYRSLGASETLIKWLKDNDCESVYCREIEEKVCHRQRGGAGISSGLQSGAARFQDSRTGAALAYDQSLSRNCAPAFTTRSRKLSTRWSRRLRAQGRRK